jgi:hypothetical protein
VIFDAPAFGRFRQRLAELAGGGGEGGAGALDPARVSPALIVATVASSPIDWLPLRADPKVDCVAPIAISAAD